MHEGEGEHAGKLRIRVRVSEGEGEGEHSRLRGRVTNYTSRSCDEKLHWKSEIFFPRTASVSVF